MKTTDFSVPRVTTRAMLDPTRLCRLKCKFCYHLHTDLESVKPWEQQRDEVLAAVAAGATEADLTGGDPTDNPHLIPLIRLCVENNVALRMITSLICPEKLLDDVMDAGISGFLVSLHGAKAETHNAIVHDYSKGPVEKTKYRQIQIKRLSRIMDRMDWHANYVMTSTNQTEMADFARWLVSLPRPPLGVNYLTFNPHYNWGSGEHRQSALENIVDLRITGPILDEAIDILEDAGISVNCRYTAMCSVSERHRKNICNDLQVSTDPFEWMSAFAHSPADLTLANAESYARNISLQNELQTEPCASCGLKQICGGANRIWHQLAMEKFGVETLVPQPVPDCLDHERPYWTYRKFNALGLDPRRPIPEPVT